MSATTTAPRTVNLPSAPVWIGVVYAFCVLGLIVGQVGDILFTDSDPHRNEGPIDEIISVGIFGTAALLIVVALGRWMVRTPERARIGALVLGALSVLSLVVMWTGAPGVLGAGAAWLAGLTRGGRPLGGAARAAGLAGAFIAALFMVLPVAGPLLSALT